MADDGRIERDAEWRANDGSQIEGASAPSPQAGGGSEEHRTMAMLAWALLVAGIVTGFAALAAVIVAYVRRGDAPDLWRGHFDGVIRMFWIWLVLSIIGFPLILLFGLGYLIMAVAAIWTAVIGVVGLFRAAERKPNRA